MKVVETPSPEPGRQAAGLRLGVVFAMLMLLIPLVTRIAARAGWGLAPTFPQRALMVLIGAYLVLTGNSIPKRLAARACRDASEAQAQAFRRFSGWTWVLTGLALGLAWIFLPLAAADTTTAIAVPSAMALVVIRWLSLGIARPPSA